MKNFLLVRLVSRLVAMVRLVCSRSCSVRAFVVCALLFPFVFLACVGVWLVASVWWLVLSALVCALRVLWRVSAFARV